MTLRRLTDLDVVIVLSSTTVEQHERVRQRLRSLHASKYGHCSGRAIAQNVYLVTAHKDLNKVRDVSLIKRACFSLFWYL